MGVGEEIYVAKFCLRMRLLTMHQWRLLYGKPFYTGRTLSESDFKLGSKRVKRNGATYIPRSLMQGKLGGFASRPKADVESESEQQVSTCDAESKKRANLDRNERALKRGRAE